MARGRGAWHLSKRMLQNRCKWLGENICTLLLCCVQLKMTPTTFNKLLNMVTMKVTHKLKVPIPGTLSDQGTPIFLGSKSVKTVHSFQTPLAILCTSYSHATTNSLNLALFVIPDNYYNDNPIRLLV